MSRRFRDICRSTIYPFEGAPHSRGCRYGGSKYRNGLVTPDFYIVVDCNYGSIWLRFRDMTRDRQTDRRTDRHPHRFMIWPHVVGHIIMQCLHRRQSHIRRRGTCPSTFESGWGARGAQRVTATGHCRKATT